MTFSTIPSQYLQDTGETIGQAVKRIHKTHTVEQAAHYVGYASATDLRRYLRERGIPDPWPPVYRGKRAARRIPDQAMRDYCRRTAAGEDASEVAEDLGFGHGSFRQKIKRAAPDVAKSWREG